MKLNLVKIMSEVLLLVKLFVGLGMNILHGFRNWGKRGVRPKTLDEKLFIFLNLEPL